MSFADYTTWFGLGSLLAVAGAVATYFRGKSAQDAKIAGQDIKIELNKAEIMKIITTIREEIAVQKVWHEITKQVIEKELPKVLLRQHTPQIDFYFRKMKDGRLQDQEKEQFIDLLQQVIDGNLDVPMQDDLRLGYLLAILKLKADLEEKKVRERFRQGNDV